MIRGALHGDGRQRLLAGHVRVTGQQAGQIVGEYLRGLADAGVGHLGQVELLFPALLIDHEQRGGVIDLPLLDLNGDVVGAPHGLQLGHRSGQEVPLVDHAVRPGVGQHVRDAGGSRVRVDAEQLHLVARGAEHLLGLQHALRGQRADRRAFGILEAQHDDLAAELAERHRLAELVHQLDVRGRQRAQRAAEVEVRVHLGGAGGRVGLHATERAGAMLALAPHPARAVRTLSMTAAASAPRGRNVFIAKTAYCGATTGHRRGMATAGRGRAPRARRVHRVRLRRSPRRHDPRRRSGRSG